MTQTQYADHDYVIVRQNRYIKTWKNESMNKLIKIMSSQDFKYNSFDKFQRISLNREIFIF